jgi:hypothetical protein
MIARNQLCLMACLSSFSVLVGCASSTPRAAIYVPAGQDVVGSGGSASDRKVVNASDQQMFDAEHAMDPDPSAGSSDPNQNLP